MVEIHSSSTHPTTTNLYHRHFDSRPTTRSRTEASPSPLLRDVGSKLPQLTQKHGPCCIRVCGSSSLNGGIRNPASGGPMKCVNPHELNANDEGKDTKKRRRREVTKRRRRDTTTGRGVPGRRKRRGAREESPTRREDAMTGSQVVHCEA